MLESLAKRWFLLAVVAAAGALLTTRALAANCPGADPDALAWLDKMSRSLREVSYQGVVTFQRGEDMQVIQLSHRVADGKASERLTQLTGQGAGVVRVDHPLHCIHPGQQLLSISADLRAGRCGVARHYRFSIAGEERVAGRQAVQIRIEPRDMYRYGYVMDMDRVTGLLLKSETVGPGEKILEKLQFANLSYSNDTADGEQVDLVHEAGHPHPDLPATVGRAGMGWDVNWLPRGFTATDHPAANTRRRTYTDGLAVFSVFLESLSREMRAGEGVARSGGTTSYTRGMHLSGRPVLVTVIGEVPVNTARMVADSISGAN